MTQSIALNKLILSINNVRKTNGEEDIESLADSIGSKGLLQNLVVSEQPGGRLYEVDAGGRRLRALQLLAERKQIPRNYPVPVHIVPRDDALEASLAENLQKLAMNPADEVEAFSHLIDGADPEKSGQIVDRAERIANCARRFGRTTRYVEQRLRLAALSPLILEALRSGAIPLEAARAYAAHPDHDVQDKLFANEQRKGSWGHRPSDIRAALEGRYFAADHPAVIYLGLPAYLEAGGRVQADLFFGEEERDLLLDPGLVRRLAQQKAEAEAQLLAQADGWLDAMVAPVDSERWAEPRPPKQHRRLFSSAGLDDAARATAIRAYRLKADGSAVEPIGEIAFLPDPPRADGDPAQSPPRDWRAEQRADRVRLYAARLAAPRVTGTPLEGRAFWPEMPGWASVQDDGEGNVVIELLVRIPATELEPWMDEAEQQLTREEHEAEARQAEQAEAQGCCAAAPDGEDEPADGEIAPQPEAELAS